MKKYSKILTVALIGSLVAGQADASASAWGAVKTAGQYYQGAKAKLFKFSEDVGLTQLKNDFFASEGWKKSRDKFDNFVGNPFCSTFLCAAGLFVLKKQPRGAGMIRRQFGRISGPVGGGLVGTGVYGFSGQPRVLRNQREMIKKHNEALANQKEILDGQQRTIAKIDKIGAGIGQFPSVSRSNFKNDEGDI